jgi:hypothetical protein
MRTIGVLALAAGLAASAQNPAPGGQAPVRTGLIVGQVVEAGSNRPVAEAIVSLTGTGPAIDTRDRGRRVMADAEGRFFFWELGPGNYQIRAVKAGYPQNYYGPRQPPLSGAPPGSIQLAEGERRGDATIVLWKYATLSGTVLDEAGEPVIGVDVRALRRSFGGGQVRFNPVNPSISSARTDDRGAFRISSLPPGHYIVAVPSSQTTMPVAVFEQNLWQRNEEVMNAIPEFQILGFSQNQRIGDSVLMTRSGVAWPPAPGDSRRLTVYPTMFHPSTTLPRDATVFSVAPGEEGSVGTIQIRPVPAVRVSGKVVGPNGPAALKALRLSAPVENIADVALDLVTGLTDQAGEFTLLGVPSGQYVLRITTPRITGAPTPPSTPEKPILWASEPVTVGDADVSGLSITLRPTFRIAGRIEFSGSKPRPSGEELREQVYLGATPVTGWGAASTAPDASGAFETGVPGGSYFFYAEDLVDWHLKAVLFEGRDISDVPIEIKGDVAGIVVLFSDDVSQIAGTVRHAQGGPDNSAFVVVFPADRQRAGSFGARFPRRARLTAASMAGTFSFKSLPPGDYLVAAIPATLLDGWQDPKALDVISRTATRVSLAENEKRTVDLRATTGR